jgi:hypothetical protein
MTSDIAMADIYTLQAEGLRPKPEDVIRLNALGLAVERAGNPDASNNAPRIVWLCNVAIHEPTIQAELWMQDVASQVSATQDAYDMLRLYACAHAQIPGFFAKASMRNITLIRVKVWSWIAANIWKATPRQIRAALEYVVNGNDPADGEYPDLTDAHPNRLKNASGTKEDALHRRVHAAMAAGLRREDVECLTWSAMNNVLLRVWRANGGDMKNAASTDLGDYYLTLDAIKKRLIAEKGT